MNIQGVMHVHSTYSYDGKESLASLRDFLVVRGISFCCVTEHADKMTVEQSQMFVQECKALSGSQFMFIPGFEVPYGHAHILMIGTEVFLAQNANKEILKAWSEASALTILAHPVRNKFKVDEALKDVLDGVEIWNQQYDGKLVPRFRSVSLLRSLQKDKPNMLATGGLDFHRNEHFGSPLYSLEVERITAEAIIDALKVGSYQFGSKKVQVASLGAWRQEHSIAHKLLSFSSIAIIVCGKRVNALLSSLGLQLPKGLRRLVRSRI